MNAQRRKKIADILARLSAIAEEVQEIGEQERDYIAAMPESLQSGERGQKAEEAADYIDCVATSLDEAISGLESATE